MGCGILKKGSQKFKEVLTRNQEIKTDPRKNSLKKTLETEPLEGEILIKSLKYVHRNGLNVHSMHSQ